MRGGFKLNKVDPSLFQIDSASSILISRERYQPLGSDFLLGSEIDKGGSSDLYISSRIYMTENQIEAETNSISYAEENLDPTPEEYLIEKKSNSASSPSRRIAPYEAFHIKGLGESFRPNWDDDPQLRDYIYLELDLWRSLDIRSAQIVVGPVKIGGAGVIPGEEASRVDFLEGEQDLIGWPSFPSPYLFNLEMANDGTLIDVKTKQQASFGQKRFQKKAYVLLAYLTKDSLVGGGMYCEDDNGERFSVVSCINSNLAIQTGLSNETAVINLVPHFDATHLSSNYFENPTDDD